MDLAEQKDQDFKIVINRIIPASYAVQLKLVPYTIIQSQPNKAGKIIQALKKINQQLDAQQNMHQKQHQKKEQQMHQNKNQTQQKKIYHHIKNKNQQSQINEQNPLNKQVIQKQKQNKMFLKRIRNVEGKIQAIVCRQDTENRNTILTKLQQLLLINKVYVKQLPAQAPLTKMQFQQWSKFWPINFIQQQISREIVHTPQQLAFITSVMNNNEDSIYLIDNKISEVLLSEPGCCSQQTIFHPVMKLLQKWPISQSYLAKPDKYYYLTDLKLYVREKICGMCSMALVHSRLKAIYMTLAPSQVMDTIMGNKKLNHQIIMFQISQLPK